MPLPYGSISRRGPLLRYALALLIVAAAAGLRLLLLPVEAGAPFATFYAATVLSFYLCGTGPGVITVLLSGLTASALFLPPFGSLEVGRAGLVSLVAFLFSALLIGVLVRQLQVLARRLRSTLDELGDSEARLRAIVQDQTDILCRFDRQGRIIFANAASRRLFGLSDADLGEADWRRIVEPEDLPGVLARLAELSPAEPEVLTENRIRLADGSLRWAEFLNHAFFDAAGQIREVQVVGRDIQQRKALEQQLAQTTASVKDLYDRAPCGYYSVDASGHFILVNQVMLGWLGCESEALMGQLGPKDFMTAEGRARFDACFPKFLADGRIEGLEFDLLGHDGRQRRVSVSATAVKNEQGDFVMSRSVMFDISELHRARGEASRLNREQAAMLDNELVGICKLRNRQALWQNRALERIFGYAPGELDGAPSRQIYLDDASFERVGTEAYPVLNAGGHYRTQLLMRRKNGEPVWIDLSGVNLPDQPGESMWLMLDISRLKAQQAQVEQLAFHDALTGLPNRLLLGDRLAQAISLNGRLGNPMAVCFIDLDGFKAVNDGLGHDAGDRLLKVIAQRLGTLVRESDTVARLGGDEFVLLLTPLASPDHGRSILQRVLEAIQAPVELGAGQTAAVSGSIGVALFPQHGRDAEVLLSRADAAMYAAKQNGRGRISFYE